MKQTILLFTLFWTFNLFGQSFTTEQKMQGYMRDGNVVVFIFDPELYEADPDRVVVTGTFRNWDQKMDEKEWTMKKTDQLWTLSVDNFEFRILKPNDEFKFRINGGLWMEPPLQSVDKKNGNMVFMKDAIIPALHAEIRGPYTIWARVTGDRPLSEEDYVISSANGERVEISAVLPQTATETLITTSEPMDIKRVYFLEIPAQGMKSFCSFDGWFRELYSGKELGAQIHGNATTIRVFAPRAERLRVYLYRNRDDTKAYRTEDMTVDENGVWEISFDENLHGTYYDFTIHGAPDPGNHFYETNPVHITDPYARVSDNTWGKCRIWEKTTPASPLQQGIPEMKDVIAYEVHVQDFTDLLPVDEALKGSFQAMIQPGLTNSRGEKIGFDYLVDLGINTVHLMPVQEYLHFPDDDWKASFADDPYMIDQGVSEENYQWGYRTSHAFAVESKYRKKGEEPGTERAAFRDLVQAFHDHGMAVIIDIVPNHTAENMDGNEWYFNFNALDKLYYYRTKNFEHIGAYGNEIKTENRPMVQRWIIDQCRHFIDEFGIDGFRIDLAGQIDQQTLLALKEALGHDKILYGEAWIGSNDPAFESNPDWDWYKEDAPITFFQDDSRNAFKGPVFELRDKYQDRGWPGGKYDERPNVMKGLANAFDADKTPVSGISYLDIHDNFALADQFASANFDGRYAVDQDLYKIAVTLLYTTLGPIVTHGGSEIMRSKAAAPLKEVVKETNAGYKIYMHGKRDTYNHRMANRFIWENVGAKPTKTNQNDYENMLAFWKGMNAFRSSIYGAVFRVADPVPQEYYEWFLPEDKSMLGYLVDESVLVLLNAGSQTNEFTNLNLPEGTWRLIAHNRAVDHADGVRDPDLGGQLSGGLQEKISLAPESLRIWVLEAPDK